MGENHGEREEDYSIIMAITMVFSDMLRFLGSIHCLLSHWKWSIIYTSCVCL